MIAREPIEPGGRQFQVPRCIVGSEKGAGGIGGHPGMRWDK